MNFMLSVIFDSAGGQPASYVAIWNGTNWRAIDTTVMV